MKKLLLQSTNYNYLENAFKEWLDVLGYAKGTVYNLPIAVRDRETKKVIAASAKIVKS